MMEHMETAQRLRYDKLGAKLVQALRKRHFDAYYYRDCASALPAILSLIPLSHTVSWGGSQTIQQLGLPQLLRQKGYTVLDRDLAQSAEERFQIMRQALLCNTFLMSSNAITLDGQLLNMDGNGNRLAALLFGPESVLVIAGMNKVVNTWQEAVWRVRHLAAPSRAQDFDGLQTPCATTGACADCIHADCICAQLLTTRISRPAKRIKVVLIGQDLGY